MKKGVNSIISAIVGTAIGAGTVGKVQSKKLREMEQMSGKHLALFLMMNQWVKIKQEGKQLSEYFQKNKFYKIAIYGMSYAGETLIDELRDSNINVAYGIDKNAASLYSDVDIISIDEVGEEVDAVVVTAITFFDEIEELLLNKVSCPIISLEDILYEM